MTDNVLGYTRSAEMAGTGNNYISIFASILPIDTYLPYFYYLLT